MVKYNIHNWLPKSWFFGVLILGLAILLASCGTGGGGAGTTGGSSLNEAILSGVNLLPDEAATELEVIGAGSSLDKQLDVPFIRQANPPGNWNNTRNCGQTSSLMVYCYYNGSTPTVQGIMDIDDWLFDHYGDPVNDYNGSYTDTEQLETMAREYGGFQDSNRHTHWSFSQLENEIENNNPVIVAVKTRMQPNGALHFMVLIGIRGDSVIVNDPGLTFGGANEYSISDFLNVWKDQGCACVTIHNSFIPPEPPEGVEQVGRTTKVAWSGAEYNNNGNQRLFAVHTGNSDGKIYFGEREADKPYWRDWNPPLPDCSTNLPVGIAYWQGQLVFAFTGGDNKIWVGRINPDRTNWSGWHFTGRSSTHGPTLASDGTVLYLVHKGSGNDRIYYSNDAPFFENNWVDTNRDTKDKPAATIGNGDLYIAHKGANDSRIYYKNITGDPSPDWTFTGRDSYNAPSIAFINGHVWIAHQGANDNKNYIGRPDIDSWQTLLDTTDTEPFIGTFKGNLFYSYVRYNRMLIQWVTP